MRLYPACYKGMIFESFSLGTPTAPRESKEKKIYLKDKRKGKSTWKIVKIEEGVRVSTI